MLAGACGDDVGDPCLGHAGSCVGLIVVDGTYRGDVDQLRIHVSGDGIDGTQVTPMQPSRRALPVRTAIYLPKGAQPSLRVSVVGVLAGQAVGLFAATFAVDDGAHVTKNAPLDAPPVPDLSMPPVDAAMPGDLAAPPDLTALVPPDLTALVPPDLTTAPDLATPDFSTTRDLATPDLTAALAPRHVFVSDGSSGGNFGALDTIDALCTHEASLAGSTSTWKALASTAGANAVDRVALTSTARAIVLPGNGGALVATDASFWSASHQHVINVDASGNTAITTCVWTGSDTSGRLVTGAADCKGWSSNQSGDNGELGSTMFSDVNWVEANASACSLPCHFYCLEVLP